MKCSKCQAPLPPKAQVCPRCGAKRAGKKPLIIAAVCLLVVLLVILAWQLGWFSGADDREQDLTLLSGAFTERIITDRQSALAAIGDVADLVGITNATAEFGSCQEDTAFDNTYYRFNQQYEGIPVYGRSMVVCADAAGNGLSLSGNYLPITGLDTAPDITAQEAIAIADSAYQMSAEITSEGLSIYSLEGHQAELAWRLSVNTGTNAEYCFVSAEDGDILAAYDRTYAATALGQGVDLDGVSQTFNTTIDGDEYLLQDERRNIFVYNANGGTIVYEYIIADSQNNRYHYNENKQVWVDQQDNPVSFQGENNYGDWSVIDSSGNIIGEHAYPAFYLTTKNIFTDVYAVTNSSQEWRDKKAVTAMSRVANSYDFYQQVLGRTGFNGINSETLVVYNDYLNGDTTNAFSTSMRLSIATLLRFGTDNPMSIDTVAHEYTHSVETSISGMLYTGESGALMEAYSDIFGEIIEDYYDDDNYQQLTINERLNGTCDWLHSTNRDLANPNNKKDPATYEGRFWADTSADANDNGGVHTNNTVISHAAYLMARGIDGGSYYEPLSTHQLAQLFYRTLFILPSDCDFSEFRSLLQHTAYLMCQEGELSNSQRLCVENAMFQVGIPADDLPRYAVARQVALTVFGVDAEPYQDYTISILNTTTSNSQELTAAEVASSGLSFPAAGEYEITITDTKNPHNVSSFMIVVRDNGGAAQLSLYTNCGMASANDIMLMSKLREQILGMWYNEAALSTDQSINYASGYTTEFRDDGTVLQTGYRNQDSGTYRITGVDTLQATFNANSFYSAETNDYVLSEDYQYTVVYTYDAEADTLYADYSAEFEAAGMSNASDGTLYRMDTASEPEQQDTDIGALIGDHSGFAVDYFYAEILPQYQDQSSTTTLTYYTQTYQPNSISWLTEYNLYNVEDMQGLLIAYNIADYDGNGVEDLLTITLEPSTATNRDYSGITGEDNVRPLILYKHLYLFDSQGEVTAKGSGNGNGGSVSGTPKNRIFAFYDDKIVELSIYDYSDHAYSNIQYPVTDDISWHTNSLQVLEYNPSAETFDSCLDLTRYTHADSVRYNIDINEDIYNSNGGTSSTESDAIAVFQQMLAEYAINDVVIPSASWENRWQTCFNISETANHPVFSLMMEPTNSVACSTTGPIIEKYTSTLGSLLGGTTGTMTFTVTSR